MHKHNYTLMGGAAGGGKTRTLVAAMAYCNILYASKGNRNPVTALATTDATSATDRFLPHIKELLVDRGLGQMRGFTKEYGSPCFVFKNPNFGIIKLASLFKPETLKGKAPWAMGIDELTLLPEKTWNEVYWTVRFSGRLGDKRNGINPFPHAGPIIAGSNPNGQHAFWVYQYFVGKTFNTPQGLLGNWNAEDYNFVPVFLRDNPNDEYKRHYQARLEASPERAALLDGVWDIRKGLRYVNLPPYQEEGIKPPDHWIKLAGLDWGLSDHSAIIWGAIDTEGVLHVYDEYVGNEMLGEEVAKICSQEPCRFICCDESMWKRESTGKPIISAWRGLNVRPTPNKGHPGNRLIGSRIESGKLVLHGCSQLYRALQGVSYGKPPHTEDLLPHDLTHAVYALGYLCFHAEGLVATAPPTPKSELEAWYEYRIRASKRRRALARRNTISL